MQKRKSMKKINNKTFNSTAKKEEQMKVPVQNIMKQIGQLKKQLVSIKSKKYLQIQQNCMKNSLKQEKAFKLQKQPLNKFQSENRLTKQKILQQKTKQNLQVSCCDCNLSGKKIKHKKQLNQYIEPLRPQLFAITAPKSRESKLKIQIQQNKLKSLLEHLLIQSPSLRQSLKLFTSELNFIMVFINTIIKQLQTQLSNTKSHYRQIRTDLSQLSDKIINVGEKYSNQKHLTVGQMQQIAELKRQLSYYITLMKDNQNEAEKCSKQYEDLEIYVKQLQQNNQLLRKQLKILEQKKQEYAQKLKNTDERSDNFEKKFALLQQDLHLCKMESQKQKQKRKQLQKLYEKQIQQKKQIVYRLSQRQNQLQRHQTLQKQLNQTIKTLQKTQLQYTASLTQRKLQIQKLQRQNTILQLTLTQKQQRFTQQQQQIREIKQRLQAELKINKKLNQSLQYCNMQIDGLSQQIDELRKANQRYKNQHFRTKLIHGQGESTNRSNEQSGSVKKTFRKQQKTVNNLHNTQSKNRKKILGQIQQLIQKHRKSSDSEDQSES